MVLTLAVSFSNPRSMADKRSSFMVAPTKLAVSMSLFVAFMRPIKGLPMPFPKETDFWDVKVRPISERAI